MSEQADCRVCGKAHRDGHQMLYRCLSCGIIECRQRLIVADDGLKHVEKGDGLCGPVFALKSWPIPMEIEEEEFGYGEAWT